MKNFAPAIVLGLALLISLVCSNQQSIAQQNRMSPELLWKLGRLGAVSVSPDEKHIAFSVRHFKLEENSGRSSIHLISTDLPNPIVPISNWKVIGGLQWIDLGAGTNLVFEGMRGDEKEPVVQAWMLDLRTLELQQMTNYPGGISNLKVSPTNDRIAFTKRIKLDETVNELYADLPLANARIIDSLMYRHWDSWHDYKYSHLHVAFVSPDGLAGESRDLMPSIKADCPVPPFGGNEQFDWSPDGMWLAFTMKLDPKWAETTNSDVYLVNVINGEMKNISQDRLGYDNDPVFSPDGKKIAFHSMETAGFEADRNRIMVYDLETNSLYEASENLDQTVHAAKWLPGGGFAYSSEHRGTDQVFAIGSDIFPVEPNSQLGKQLSSGQYNFALKHVFRNGKVGLITVMSMLKPMELALLNFETGETQFLSQINDDHFYDLELPMIEERWVDATDGKKIHCWIIYPPNFDKNKKYPLLTYCQGGPQGQIGQFFSFRWNFHLMAAQDYVIVAPNRRGLPGFGQAWNDQISGDWGGQAMQDILSATDAMLAEPYIDKNRAGAVGASFGGYTVYWLMGNAEERFACMISHCGVFNLESMYGSTEELFFVNHDLGGPYWKSPELQQKYDQFSPHRFVKNWKTPLLVIHGELDFRVPITQGIEAFTAAQVEGVPSRFLYFPAEGHWVMGPQNGVLWHRVFFDWLDRHLK
ncbi:MAG TPA: S9 family peptidase [Pirellulaceae bacterium]|nr:S9 family peptidase [Pirellulaceae bacterium]HMO93541.1 S9 family peptidase [Pirellulaceae bacterium]HMP70347.1 S9 family peptidase [Pirellulaceae bacterium]